jgi:hypothetical protein
MIVVAGLLDPRWLFEVELDACLDSTPHDPSGPSGRSEAAT